MRTRDRMFQVRSQVLALDLANPPYSKQRWGRAEPRGDMSQPVSIGNDSSLAHSPIDPS